MVGRRWDTNITQPLSFKELNWENDLNEFVKQRGSQRSATWIDYFVFSKNLYHHQMPPFVIGRNSWDPWLVWKAISAGATVVDASGVVVAVHQNHDYSYHPDGAAGVWQGEEAQQNYALLQGGRCFATMENATHRLSPEGLRPNYRHYAVQARRKITAFRNAAWFGFLNATRPLRHRLGLRERRVPEAPSGGK